MREKEDETREKKDTEVKTPHHKQFEFKLVRSINNFIFELNNDGV